MAFKKINSTMTAALSCDKDNKVVEGYLVGSRGNIGKYKKTIFLFIKKDGKTGFELWGSTVIDGCLLDEKTKQLLPSFKGLYARITFEGQKKTKDGQKYNLHTVEIDENLRLKKGKLPF